MNSEYRILIKENRVIKGGTCIPMTIPACFREDKSNFFIGEINNFKNLVFNKRLNNYGTCRFDILVDDTEANALISLCEYSVYIYRVTSNGDVLVWSGEQRRRTGDLKENHNDWCTIYCYDWLYALKDRYTAQTVTYTDIDAGKMAWYLIDTTQGNGSYGDTMVDFSSNNNINSWWVMPNNYTKFGQSFTGNGKKLSKISIFLARNGSVTGTIRIKLYASTGGDGQSIPTGTELATSDIHQINEANNIAGDFTKLPTTAGYNKIDFLFDETFTLVDNTKYVFVLEYISLNAGFYIAVENPSPSNKNASYLDNESPQVWQYSDKTIPFYIESPETVIIEDAKKDFGITEGTIATTQDRSRTYENQNIMEAIINLSDVINGFDFEITNDKVFNVYTVKGTDLTDSLILEYGRNLSNVSVDEDFTTPCNNAIVLGEVIDGTELTRVDRPDTTTQAKYKLREMVLSADNVIDEDTLNEKGDAMLYKYKEPLMKITFEVIRGMIDVTQFSLGDLIRLIIKKGCYNIDTSYRIFEWTVDHENDNTEKLSLILGELGI